MFKIYFEKCDTKEFVDYWSERYNYKNENLYDNNINTKLDEDKIWELFQWKNGKTLSQKKIVSVKENYINEKDIIKSDVGNDVLIEYLNRKGGAIWRIFWIHCNYPEVYPIYDQHVHRAMAFLLGWDELGIPGKNKAKVNMYVNEYIPFYNSFNYDDRKKLDEALWAFGKFLTYGYI